MYLVKVYRINKGRKGQIEAEIGGGIYKLGLSFSDLTKLFVLGGRHPYFLISVIFCNGGIGGTRHA